MAAFPRLTWADSMDHSAEGSRKRFGFMEIDRRVGLGEIATFTVILLSVIGAYVGFRVEFSSLVNTVKTLSEDQEKHEASPAHAGQLLENAEIHGNIGRLVQAIEDDRASRGELNAEMQALTEQLMKLRLEAAEQRGASNGNRDRSGG